MRKIPNNTSFFTYRNTNPKNKYTGDCVMRALSALPEQNWYKVYDELCVIGRKLCCSPTNDEAWDAWLKEHGYVRCKMPKHENGRLYMLRDFTRSDFIGDHESVIVSISGHLTCIQDRKIIDTWNCAGYKVRRYYKKVK